MQSINNFLSLLILVQDLLADVLEQVRVPPLILIEEGDPVVVDPVQFYEILGGVPLCVFVCVLHGSHLQYIVCMHTINNFLFRPEKELSETIYMIFPSKEERERAGCGPPGGVRFSGRADRIGFCGTRSRSDRSHSAVCPVASPCAPRHALCVTSRSAGWTPSGHGARTSLTGGLSVGSFFSA